MGAGGQLEDTDKLVTELKPIHLRHASAVNAIGVIARAQAYQYHNFDGHFLASVLKQICKL